MISIGIATAVFLYVTLSLVVIFAVWIFYEKESVHPKFVREKATVWNCAICAFTYVDSKHLDISRCPQCKSYNKRDPEDRYIAKKA